MLGLGSWWAAGWGFRQPRGLSRGIGAAVVAWAWVILGVLALGLTGWLARGPLLAWAGLGLAIAAIVRWRSAPPPEPEVSQRDPNTWERSTTFALGLSLWALVAVGVPAWLLPIQPVSDGPIYHLYFAAQWWKAGRIFLVPMPFGDTSVTYVPANGELFFAALMALWGGDRLARIGQVPFLLLSAASVFAIARRLHVGFAAAFIATAWFVTNIVMILYSFQANVDTILVAAYLAAAYFLLRYALCESSLATLALGALAAGESLGTKATGVVFVPPLLALGALAVSARQKAAAARIAQLAALALLPVLSGGFWFGRNLWLTGNPIYPLQLSLFGRVLLVGWHDAGAMSQSEFWVPVNEVRALADNLLLLLDLRLAPLYGLALVGVWAIGPSHFKRPWIWLCSGLSALNFALYWILIPYRTQQRFMLPALAAATIPLAALFDRGKWLRWAAVCLLALHLVTPPTWPLTPLDRQVNWGFTQGLMSPMHGLIVLPLTWRDVMTTISGRYPKDVVLVFTTILCAVLALAAASSVRRLTERPSTARGLVVIGLLAALVAAPAGLLWKSYGARTFPQFTYLRGWTRLDRLAGPSGARIAYAGMNRAYYLMGARLRNHVAYVNIDAHRHWRLHDYHREAIRQGQPNWPDPRPGWDRIHPDYDAWISNLAAERIQLLVVTRANPADGSYNVADPEGFPIERVWADAHPEAFTVLYGPAEGDANFRIYQVHPHGPNEDRAPVQGMGEVVPAEAPISSGRLSRP
jgi:hypothetical protein